MAYTSGSTILDDEYNNFANDVNTVLGAGSGSFGYGQSSTISTVSPGAVITATQWATLLNRISTLANHQNTSITAITNPTVGDQIAILSALQGNITLIEAGRRNAAANGTAITSGGVSSRTTAWNGIISTTQRITFASADHMRYFFNAGGRISISFSRTGGTAENKNTGWSNLCTACGTIHLSGAGTSKTIAGVAYTGTTKIGGSGTVETLSTTVGFEQLTTAPSNTILFRQYDATAQYTANYLAVYGQKGTNYVELITNFVDNADANTDENVDGTLSATVTAIPPSTTYLTNTWGTPTLSTTEAL